MSELTSLYVHIPFCTTKCTYCAFNTYTKIESLIPDFIEALQLELRFVLKSRPDLVIHTIFFGGGTPSLLTADQVGSVLDTVRSMATITTDAEVTLEANPNDITPEYLDGLQGRGVNRMSLGMQSADEHLLRLFARRHGNEHIIQAVRAAKQTGLTNFNLDLMYGVPHQTLESWRWTLHQALHLQPQHFSLYALGLEPETPMESWVTHGQLPAPDDDLAADMYDLACEMLAGAGYEQYEISNWARPGYACQHNLQYWHNRPYLGLGPGAHGYAAGIRYTVLRSPQRYINAMMQENNSLHYPLSPAHDTWHEVTMDAEISETLMMGLRLTQEGIRWADFQQRFGVDLLSLHGETINRFADTGLLIRETERLRLSERGRLLSNVVLRELI